METHQTETTATYSTPIGWSPVYKNIPLSILGIQ